MELIKSVAKRSRVSDVVYIILNLALAGLVLGLTLVFTPPYLAYLVVILSKWRIFAVRPRFWLANLRTNTVDMLVGLSVVTMIWQASGSLLVQVLLAVLYAAWLIILKPRSRRSLVLAQAAIAQFLALTALFSVAHNVDVVFIVLTCWLIGYVVAYHEMSAYEETETTLLSIVWGFVVAEMGWIGYHWTVAYQLSGDLLVPQIAIIVGVIGYIVRASYDVYHKGNFAFKKIRAQLLFGIAIIGILLIRELSAIFRYTS